MTSQLPPYSLRKSNRARSVRLSISAEHGLVVTIPASCNPADVPALLQQKLDWIHSAMDKVQQQGVAVDKLPDRLDLQSIHERWSVLYKKSSGRKTVLRENAGRVLVIEGPLTSKTAIRRLLKSWLRSKAQLILPSWLERLSMRSGLGYNRLTIRDQRTRWGSCSSSKGISLNLKLILLPADIVDYVLLHELSHTVHLSHSQKFWNELSKYVPDHQQRRKALRTHENTIRTDYPGL